MTVGGRWRGEQPGAGRSARGGFHLGPYLRLGRVPFLNHRHGRFGSSLTPPARASQTASEPERAQSECDQPERARRYRRGAGGPRRRGGRGRRPAGRGPVSRRAAIVPLAALLALPLAGPTATTAPEPAVRGVAVEGTR